MIPVLQTISLGTFSLFTLFKIGVTLLLFMHVAFSVILLRQTRLMTRVVTTPASPFLFFIALFHLLASIFVVIWTIMYL
jgi:hypothetical protein